MFLATDALSSVSLAVLTTRRLMLTVWPPVFLQACISMKPRVDMDISGQDIACKSNQFCQVCGSVEDVKNACMQDNR